MGIMTMPATQSNDETDLRNFLRTEIQVETLSSHLDNLESKINILGNIEYLQKRPEFVNFKNKVIDLINKVREIEPSLEEREKERLVAFSTGFSQLLDQLTQSGLKLSENNREILNLRTSINEMQGASTVEDQISPVFSTYIEQLFPGISIELKSFVKTLISTGLLEIKHLDEIEKIKLSDSDLLEIYESASLEADSVENIKRKVKEAIEKKLESSLQEISEKINVNDLEIEGALKKLSKIKEFIDYLLQEKIRKIAEFIREYALTINGIVVLVNGISTVKDKKGRDATATITTHSVNQRVLHHLIQTFKFVDKDTQKISRNLQPSEYIELLSVLKSLLTSLKEEMGKINGALMHSSAEAVQNLLENFFATNPQTVLNDKFEHMQSIQNELSDIDQFRSETGTINVLSQSFLGETIRVERIFDSVEQLRNQQEQRSTFLVGYKAMTSEKGQDLVRLIGQLTSKSKDSRVAIDFSKFRNDVVDSYVERAFNLGDKTNKEQKIAKLESLEQDHASAERENESLLDRISYSQIDNLIEYINTLSNKVKKGPESYEQLQHDSTEVETIETPSVMRGSPLKISREIVSPLLKRLDGLLVEASDPTIEIESTKDKLDKLKRDYLEFNEDNANAIPDFSLKYKAIRLKLVVKENAKRNSLKNSQVAVGD